MTSNQISPGSENRSTTTNIFNAIQGVLMALIGAAGVVAGLLSLVAGTLSIVLSQASSSDILIWFSSILALGFGCVFLFLGRKTMVDSGLIVTDQDISKPLLGLFGLLLISLGGLLLIIGFAAISLSVFINAGILLPLPINIDELIIGFILVLSAIICSVMGVILITRSNCIIGLNSQ